MRTKKKLESLLAARYRYKLQKNGFRQFKQLQIKLLAEEENRMLLTLRATQKVTVQGDVNTGEGMKVLQDLITETERL